MLVLTKGSRNVNKSIELHKKRSFALINWQNSQNPLNPQCSIPSKPCSQGSLGIERFLIGHAWDPTPSEWIYSDGDAG